MRKLLIKSFVLTILLLFPITAFSEENFCLDKDGFIYPLFDETNCNDLSDDKINKNEFSHIIDFNGSLRLTKLEEYRKNSLEIEKNKDIDLAKNLQEKTDSNKSKILEKRKRKIEQEKLAKLAKEVAKKKLYEERKLKNEKRIAENKKIREEQKRKILARQEEQKRKILARQEEIKIKKEELKKQKIAKKLAKKKLYEERKLKKEKEKELKLEKITTSKKKELKHKKKITKKNETVNENLKIVLVNNKIVKNELLPKVNGDVEIIEGSNKDTLDNLFQFNKNLLVLIPRDFENSSVTISENQMLSQMVIGIDQLPNPEINRIEAELRRAERDYIIAERKFQRATSAATNYNPYGGWGHLLNQWAGLAAQHSAGEARSNARQRLESWSAKLSSTPMYIEKERLGSYNYQVAMIKSEKKSVYDVLKFNNGKFFAKDLEIKETNDFKVAYGINTQDKNYKSLNQKYSTEEDVTKWSNQKFRDLSIDTLITKLNTGEQFKELKSKRLAYKMLGHDIKKSFWSNLFNFFSIDNKKIVSISNKSSYEIKDVRFDSVVIVKTEKGLGSGFFISKDEILTNYHVVENALSISIIDKNKKRSSAVVIKKDLKRDLALLKTNISGKPVRFHEGQLNQGDMVEALGHPEGRKFSLTKGWISAIRKEAGGYNATGEKNVLFIQTDAAINHGNSGGPLFYKDKVVGVNTQGLSNTEGMNFAVHFSEVQKFLLN